MAKKGVSVKKTKKTTAKTAAHAVKEEKTPSSSIQIAPKTIEKAVSALSKWNAQRSASAEKSNLLEDDDEDIPLILQVSSTKFFSEDKILRVGQMALPNPVIAEDIRVCVIAKDGLITNEILQQIEDKDLPHFQKVITVTDLKTTYKPYQSRRRLLSEFDLFLIDSNVITLMPKLLGKIFYQSSKLPLTIRFTPEKKFSLEAFEQSYTEALTSLAYTLPMGNNMVMRIGFLGQDVAKLQENLTPICEFLNQFQIRSLQLKLSDSPSLPIYTVDKIYTESDIAATQATILELTEAEKEKMSEEDQKEELIFQEGLKELGFEQEEVTKRPIEDSEPEKPAKKSKKN